MRLNAHRLNAPLESLYSYALNRRIDATLAAGDDVGDFISRAASAAADLVREPAESEVRICKDGIAHVVASPTNGLALDGAEIDWATLRSRVPGLFGSGPGPH